MAGVIITAVVAGGLPLRNVAVAGTGARIIASFADAEGAVVTPADPTITVTAPDSTVTVYSGAALYQAETGVIEASFPVSQLGWWTAHVSCTDPASGAGMVTFTVAQAQPDTAAISRILASLTSDTSVPSTDLDWSDVRNSALASMIG